MSAVADAAEYLIDYALALRWDGLSPAVRRSARLFLHDTLAVGAAGRNAAHADAVLAMAQGWGAGNVAGVLGRPGLRMPAASAAFVNAFQIHGQEFDCVHEPAVLHPLATVLAAVLAETERGNPVDGQTLLAALVAGVDVAVTLGLAAGPLSFFRPATAGSFGCVAAISALRRLPRAVALDAMGHALAFAAGTMQAHVEGKPALPVQVANAARASLVAIDLARAGMPGVAHPIEGPFGYFALLEQSSDLAPALARLGQGYRISEVSWKPFPTGRAGHGGIVAAQGMIAEQGVRPEQIERLEYHAPPLIHRLVGRPATADMAPGYARLCLPYLVAVALRRGTVELADFTPQCLSDPETLALATRIVVVADDNPDPAAFVPARMIAKLADGQRLEQTVTAQFGAPEWPLSDIQHLAKAKACLDFAGLGGSAAGLAKAIANIDHAPDAIAALRQTGIIG